MNDNLNVGQLHHLVTGNTCVLTDGRKTKGFIKSINIDEGMFLWEIVEYEDKGKCWEMRLEEVKQFLFPYTSKIIENESDLILIQNVIDKFSKRLKIKSSVSKKMETEKELKEINTITKAWLLKKSAFLNSNNQIDFERNEGYVELYEDLKQFLSEFDLYSLEKNTGDILVLNPYSGEWMKGMRIALAELGFISFDETIPRTKSIFLGDGELEKRKKYLLFRISFLQTLFKLLGVSNIPIYRGIQTTETFYDSNSETTSSWTTSLNVGLSFSSFDEVNNDILNACLIKYNCPIEYIFMTYLETESFNVQYKEQEVLIFDHTIL